MTEVLRTASSILPTHDRPCAAPGLTSYRYRGRYGWIMIGADSAREALEEALRSTDEPAHMDRLEVYDFLAGQYTPVDR